ncbi:uncharacterized protein LOC117571245 [Drosophila albomicans]|uniref:Uncharacterized protein LOC117571245 n=1 Tax=Drosophila albomicans TaxID=7291 RepID=A0A6P8XCM5_DROAB|nr:uncharacterized protein LOC117571245 [Drosophila albomicans]
MEGERFDASRDALEPNSLKPDTTLELEIEECNNSSVDDTPPAMIIVETCINSALDSRMPIALQAATKQADAIETVEQEAGCSITLGLKPNVQFMRLPQSAATTQGKQQLSSTEAALAAANISCATEIFAGNSKSYVTAELEKLQLQQQQCRSVADGATQCNNLNNLDYEASNSSGSVPSIGSLVCRICHNADNPEQLVSPCLCKGSLSYVHVHCLERWISTSRCTICELCQFHYNTEQTLRYTCLQSLRLWYSRAMSRRALQEDCQMFSLLTLVAFGIIGTLLVGIQYYALNTQSWGVSKLWTKSWMLFFLLMTIVVYFANVYMLVKSQLTPWYRWWQSARDIKLILENKRPFPNPNRVQPLIVDAASVSASMFTHHDQQDVHPRSSQPTFVTPTSSANSSVTSLPPPPPPLPASTAAKSALTQALPEAAIELAMLCSSPQSPEDCATLTSDGDVTAAAEAAAAEREQLKEATENSQEEDSLKAEGNGN